MNLAAAFFATVSLIVSPSTVHPGDVVTIHGNAGDCPVGDAVTIISHAFGPKHEFAGVPAVYAHVRAGGVFSVRTSIPRTRAKGRYAVTARCGGGTFGIKRYLVVR